MILNSLTRVVYVNMPVEIIIADYRTPLIAQASPPPHGLYDRGKR